MEYKELLQKQVVADGVSIDAIDVEICECVRKIAWLKECRESYCENIKAANKQLESDEHD